MIDDTKRVTSLAASTIPKLSRFQQHIRLPGQLLQPNGIVFHDLAMAVKRHLQMLMLPSFMDDVERALLIAGAPGDGKSTTACDTALRFGWATLKLPAAALAGETENAAAAALDEAMHDVVDFSKRTRLNVCVILDDFDLSIAGNTTDSTLGKTVNTFGLINRLQDLCDKPKQYRNAGDNSPVPFILTGNDFSKTRDSLIRDGRMTRVTHAPSADDKHAFAIHLLKPTTVAEYRLVAKVAGHFKGEPIAFFTSLRNDLLRTRLDALLTDGPADPDRAERALAKGIPLDSKLVWALANARATKTTSHLNLGF